jgi:formylglycine-generating enzyme required for sulfatase activity
MRFFAPRLAALALLSGLPACDHSDLIGSRGSVGDALPDGSVGRRPLGGSGGTAGVRGAGGSHAVADASMGAGGSHAVADASVGAGGSHAVADASRGAGGSHAVADASRGAGGSHVADASRASGGSRAIADGAAGSGADATSTLDGSSSGGAYASCDGLPSDCGKYADEWCCQSPLVTGGSFVRNFAGSPVPSGAPTATVSDFRLDKFEITVARYQRFSAAWNAGYRPTAGSGKHAHLNGGRGLAMSGGGYESGWDPSWNGLVLSRSGPWIEPPDATHYDATPMTGIDWYAAYAFCIWDGGFLPSDTEWNYAAAGGSEQRLFPWSNPPGSATIDCSYANYLNLSGGPPPYGYCYNGVGGVAPVGSTPKGDGKYGQSDLAGNAWEWTLDWLNSPLPSCVDCTDTQAPAGPGGWQTYKMLRSGAMDREPTLLYTTASEGQAPSDPTGYLGVGARCARSP